jgi:hypothetical protein
VSTVWNEGEERAALTVAHQQGNQRYEKSTSVGRFGMQNNKIVPRMKKFDPPWFPGGSA